jgi:hypothetical protein
MTEEVGKTVGLISPVTSLAAGLSSVVNFQRFIRHQYLRDSQFPDAIHGSKIVKPADWVKIPEDDS